MIKEKEQEPNKKKTKKKKILKRTIYKEKLYHTETNINYDNQG